MIEESNWHKHENLLELKVVVDIACVKHFIAHKRQQIKKSLFYINFRE
jgi:hypothetical protein